MAISKAKSYANEGNRCYQNGEYNKAIECFTKALNESDNGGLDASSVYCLRGASYEEKDEIDKALYDYTKAAELSEFESEEQEIFAYLHRGKIYADKNILSEAFADWRKAAVLDSDAAKEMLRARASTVAKVDAEVAPQIAACRQRGDAYKEKGQWREAAAEWKKAAVLGRQRHEGREAAALLEFHASTIVKYATAEEKAEAAKAATDKARHASYITDKGLRYWNGDGVPKDMDKAVKLWVEAAMLGESGAMANLGRLSWKGEGGVPQDMNQAIHWYSRAAERGSEKAKQWLKQYGSDSGAKESNANNDVW